MRGRRRHPRAGVLQALVDGELPFIERSRVRLHLWWCASCAARRREIEHAAQAARDLLTLDEQRLDISDAWARFVVRSDQRALRPGAGLRSGWTPAARTLVLTAACGMAMVADWSPPINLVTRMYRLAAQDRVAPKMATRHDQDFARSLLALESEGALRRVSDVCCADRDGEGPADDGVLTVELAGSRSPVVILYEDTKRAGRFQSGDVILMVSRPGLSVAAAGS
jgi:hypothetical protein